MVEVLELPGPELGGLLGVGESSEHGLQKYAYIQQVVLAHRLHQSNID